MVARLIMITLLAAAAGGCVRYEYDIIEPAEFSGEIGEKTDVVFRTDAAEYRWRTVSNRLVLRIYNNAEDPLTLLGQRSVVVDPEGESHPLITQTIEPGSFIKLIFPPPPATVERTGPSIHFGIGAGYRYGHYRTRYPHSRFGHARYGYYDPFYYDRYPRYYRVYDTSNPTYWDWRGEGQIRLKLVYERQGGGIIEDRFVIAREKK